MRSLGHERISAALFGKTRRAVLALLYGHPDEAFYVRQIARTVGVGMGALQRELKGLSEAGIVRRTVRGNQVYYQAEPECPAFGELKGLVLKTFGLADVLRGALAPLSNRIRVAFVHGSFARGTVRASSDVDLLVIGEVTFAEVVAALSEAQRVLGREVNPTIYPPDEFRSKLAAGHHFLNSVLSTDKVFLIGDENELARLGGKPLAR